VAAREAGAERIVMLRRRRSQDSRQCALFPPLAFARLRRGARDSAVIEIDDTTSARFVMPPYTRENFSPISTGYRRRIDQEACDLPGR